MGSEIIFGSCILAPRCTPLLKEKVCVSFKLSDAFFRPEDGVLSGVYFDLLKFQRESVPAVGDHVGPPNT